MSTTIASRFASAAFLGGLAVWAAPSAHAADMQMQTSIVSTAGLKLATPEGEMLLKARVRAAVRAVCGTTDNRDLEGTADMKRCRALAARDAEAQTNTILSAARSRNQLAASGTVTASSLQR